MKTMLELRLLSLALLLSTLIYQPSTSFAQGTAFTYNGRLNTNGIPVTGTYDLRATLYDANAAGLVVAGPLPAIPVGVTNGLFTVALDFGAGVFTGPARWLNLEVRPTGGGPFTALAPRQEVTSSPYSIRAQTAGTAASVANGAVTAGQLNTGGLPPTPGQFLSYNGGNLFWSDPGVAAGNIWSQLNNNAYYNAGNVGIGTTTPSTYGHGGTARILEVNNSGTTLNSQAHLMLYSGVSSLANSAMGTVTWAQPGGMAAYIGAQTRSTTPNAPAAMLSFGTRKIGDAAATPKMVITEDGKVGVGTLTPNYQLDVFSDTTTAIFGRSTAVSGVGVFGESSQFNGVRGLAHNANHGGVVGVHDGGGIAVYGTGATGVQGDSSSITGYGGYFRNTAAGVALGVEGKTQLLGQDTLQLIGFEPFLTLYDGNTGYSASRIQAVGGDLNFFTQNYLRVNNPDLSAYAKLFNSGNFSVKTLTIRGGADLAEPFEFSGSDIAKGSVLVIDDEQPGKLKLSDRAYDTRVAGIVSGANGVNPGISLHQEGVLDSGQNVALSGRVYVRADATLGAIRPGDLLTTSGTPGHAMRVSKPGKAQGAILGKAMSPLKEGKGMVLVLVTLQ